jgi:hypothetical protein
MKKWKWEYEGMDTLSQVTRKNSSQNFVQIFWFSSILHVESLIILTVWMKVHASFSHCFYFHLGCAATKLLHIRPLQTRVLQCSSFNLHDAFRNLLSWSQFFSWALFFQFHIQAFAGILSWFVLFIPTTFPYFILLFIALISKVFIFKSSLFISCSLV